MPSVETHETDDERMLHRMLFFTDAVFAIVLTLLALELKPPQAADAREAMAEIGNHLITFAMSFAVVAVFWLSHMSMMRRLAHFDWLTALMNLLFMAPVCLLPFASSLLNGTWFSSLGWQIYSWNLVLTSACLILLILVSTRDSGRLVGGISRQERWYRITRAAAPGVAFLAGLIAAQFGWLSAPIYLWLWIPIQFLLAERFVKPKASSVPAA